MLTHIDKHVNQIYSSLILIWSASLIKGSIRFWGGHFLIGHKGLKFDFLKNVTEKKDLLQIFCNSHRNDIQEENKYFMGSAANASPPSVFVVRTSNSVLPWSTTIQRWLYEISIKNIFRECFNFKFQCRVEKFMSLLKNLESLRIYWNCLTEYLLAFIYWISRSLPFFASL